jgi:hypothetical protein
MISLGLEMPEWVSRGIRPNHKGSRMDKIVYGADTETYRGLPMTLQFYSEDVACERIEWVDAKSAQNVFLKWCKSLRVKCQHIVYIHNLAFDLPELLWRKKENLVSAGSGEFDFSAAGFRIHGVYGAPTFARINDSAGRSIYLIDSFSFYRGSLASAADLFCPDLPKLDHPAQLGEKLFTKRDTAFVAYAMRDAVVAYHIGKAIQKIHEEFDLTQCVSVADLAARIFRHRFLTYTIPQPSRDIIDVSLESYHGGKNNITVPAGWYTGVSALDLSSAYPAAMRDMPAFSNEKLYRKYRAKGSVHTVPDYGVYRVSGCVDACAWPSVFSHGFKPLRGEIHAVSIQGFELNGALKRNEIHPSKVTGWYYDKERDAQAPALRGFCDEFYARKSEESDPVLRQMWKFILNSISGKFIQTRKRGAISYTDIDADATTTAADLVAGGMFHPFIASAITAHTRSRIHDLEHKWSAIHTATDGIMTLDSRARAVGSGMGSITLEAKDATLLLIRNKCYVLYAAKSSKTTPSLVFKGKHILKSARHGFQGSVTELERLIASGRRQYNVSRPHRLKEAINRGLTPNEFATRTYTLKVGALKLTKKPHR